MLITKIGDSRTKLEDKIEKANKILAKYGYETIQILNETEIYTIPGNNQIENPERVTSDMKFREYKWEIEIPINHVGQDGTEFIAHLEFGSDAAGARITPAYEETDPCASEYEAKLMELGKQNKNCCDHCNKVRTRKALFLFKKEGKIWTIGSSCAKEWHGVNIEGFLSAWKCVGNFMDEDDCGYRDNAMRRALFVSEILTYTVASIERMGFVHGKYSNTTADDAMCCYNWVHVPESRKGRSTPETLDFYRTNRDRINEIISKMSDWYTTFEPTNLFDQNLRSAVLDLALTVNQAPWAVVKWMQNNGLEVKKGDGITPGGFVKPEVLQAPNEFVANVGDKVSEEGQIVMTRAFDGDYGVTYMIKINTSKGVLVWFSSKFDHENCNYNDLVVGTKIKITGKVKKLDTYNDSKQTVITRCKLSKEN